MQWNSEILNQLFKHKSTFYVAFQKSGWALPATVPVCTMIFTWMRIMGLTLQFHDKMAAGPCIGSFHATGLLCIQTLRCFCKCVPKDLCLVFMCLVLSSVLKRYTLILFSTTPESLSLKERGTFSFVQF